MPLVTSTEMFRKAYDGGVCHRRFQRPIIWKIVQGITEACQEEHAPVILQVSKGARAYAQSHLSCKAGGSGGGMLPGYSYCPCIWTMARNFGKPAKCCIDGGFTSVMY